MDSRPHLTPRSTHIMCPLYICMHTHAGPLVLSFAPHAPLPSCLAAWAEHRNCFCFVFIALSGRPLSLSPCVCVLLYGSNESVCAGRPTLRLFVLFFIVLWLSAPIPRVCDDMRNLRVCSPLLSLSFLSLDSLVAHSCSACIGSDKHTSTSTCTHTPCRTQVGSPCTARGALGALWNVAAGTIGLGLLAPVAAVVDAPIRSVGSAGVVVGRRESSGGHGDLYAVSSQ
ncbi:hypothetical protein ECC02_011383 [Trypanosoma cruzi]|uniref:Uncharacterized protein n=1 Tax=Trypanosoma cruzi TaxID=5693 RepID=A0A7J6XMY7_TRYCR|nr:hypothetical protein ECC02_011383 [Trypanosoma cruzi]